MRRRVLSDNGSEFLSHIFIRACVDLGLIQRTVRPGHAWSNGKVEALNKTPQYPCFPAVAGNVATCGDAVGRPLPKRVAAPERCQEVDGLPFALVLEPTGAHGESR